MNSVIKAVITSNEGIHARTTVVLLNIINKYKVEAFIKYNEQMVNFKHLVEVIALAIGHDAEFEIIITGEKHAECAEELATFIKNNLGVIL